MSLLTKNVLPFVSKEIKYVFSNKKKKRKVLHLVASTTTPVIQAKLPYPKKLCHISPMSSLTFFISSAQLPEKDNLPSTKTSKSGSFAFVKQNLDFQVSTCSASHTFVCLCSQQPHLNPLNVANEQEDDEEYVQVLRVPQDWLSPSKALEVPLLIYS